MIGEDIVRTSLFRLTPVNAESSNATDVLMSCAFCCYIIKVSSTTNEVRQTRQKTKEEGKSRRRKRRERKENRNEETEKEENKGENQYFQ